jgi:hypothetical protein
LCSSILSCMARRSSPSDANDASTPLLYTHVRCARTRRTSPLCRAAATATHAAAWIVLTDTSAQHPVSESCCRHVYPNHQKSRFSEFFRNSFFFFSIPLSWCLVARSQSRAMTSLWHTSCLRASATNHS